MSSQRKLTAMLHELQHARTPVARARVMARAWRTVRELSPTDRRLLARHAGFEGAEEILEGLARRKGGIAPATLLQALANARSTDASVLTELLAAIRDPRRRVEAIDRAAELANDLLAETVDEEGKEEEEAVGGALEELQAVEESLIETPEEALGALNALDPESEPDLEGTLALESASAPASEKAGPPDPEAPTPPEAGSAQHREPEPAAEIELISEPEPLPPPSLIDWSRWQSASMASRAAPHPTPESGPSISDVGSRRFEARAVMGAMGAAPSVLSQLNVLRRELSGFRGSSIGTLRELIESFPDGWARRRAVCALLEAEIPVAVEDALELVSRLGRDVDRCWCLGLLARRGELRGSLLTRALDLVGSPHGKRRLARIVHEDSSRGVRGRSRCAERDS